MASKVRHYFFLGCFHLCAPVQQRCSPPWVASAHSHPCIPTGPPHGMMYTHSQGISTHFTFKMADLTPSAPHQSKETLLRSTTAKTNSVNRSGPCSSAPPGPLRAHPDCFLLDTITCLQSCPVSPETQLSHSPSPVPH